MRKATVALKILYPKLICVTCVAHALHLVAEEVRSLYPSVDKVISETKKIFNKSPARVLKYKEMFPELPLPPKPIITRWGTWLEAASFYAKHFEQVKQVVDSLDPKDAASIGKMQSLYSDPKTMMDLAVVETNYTFLPGHITKLEDSKLALNEAIGIAEEVTLQLSATKCVSADVIKTRLKTILQRNEGYQMMKLILKAQSGEISDVTSLPQLTPSQIASLKYAPLTTCSVERSFSSHKHLLTDRRQRLTPGNLEMLLVCKCYYNKN